MRDGDGDGDGDGYLDHSYPILRTVSGVEFG
jgi:hypothetical protein